MNSVRYMKIAIYKASVKWNREVFERPRHAYGDLEVRHNYFACGLTSVSRQKLRVLTLRETSICNFRDSSRDCDMNFRQTIR